MCVWVIIWSVACPALSCGVKKKSEVHKTMAFSSATACFKTIKPVESNLDDLGFPEFPGKAEPGSQHGVKRRGCLDRRNHQIWATKPLQSLTSNAGQRPAQLNPSVFVKLQARRWWTPNNIVKSYCASRQLQVRDCSPLSSGQWEWVWQFWWTAGADRVVWLRQVEFEVNSD